MNRGLSWALNVELADAASKPLLGFARTVQRTEKQTERAGAAAKAAGVDLKDLGGAARYTQSEFDQLTAAEKRAVVESTKLGTNYGKVALGAVQLEKKLDAARGAQEKLNDVQQEGSRLGGKLKGGALAGGAIVGAALSQGINGALDIQAGRANLKARMGLTAVDARRAGRVAGTLYSKAYGESMESVNDAVTAVGQNISRIADTSKADLERITGNTLNLQQAFGAEAQETTRTVGALVKNGMAKDVEEAFDLITTGYQRGADKGGEFLDTLNEYAEPMKSLGLNARDFTSLLVEGAEEGIYSVDKIGDAFKEFSIRAVDGSTASQDAYKAIGLDADAYAQKIKAGGPAAKQATSEIMAALRGVSDPVKRETAGVALFGSMFEDIGEQAILGLDPARSALGKTSGAAKRLGDDLGGTSKAKITAFRREFENGLANVLADKVIPGLEGAWEAAKPTVKVIGDLAEAAGDFGGKHPELAQAAAAIVGVGVAIKGIRFAGAVTGVSSLLRGLGRLTGVGRTAGTQLGNELGDALADSATSRGRRGLSREGSLTRGGVRGRMGSVGKALGGILGLELGDVAAERASDALGRDGAISNGGGKGKGKGGGLLSKMKIAGGILGRALGVSIGAAAAAGVSKLVGDALDRLILGDNNEGKKDARGRALDPLRSNSNPLGPLIEGGKSLIDRLRGNRGGGVITRYQGGGLVPALISSGEQIEEPGGRTWTVPGERVAADNVFAMLPARSKVWTEDSQERRAAGEHVDVNQQVPHFREGGKVQRFARGGFVSTAYGPPWNTMNGTGVTRTGINLKNAPQKYIVAVDPTVIPLKTKTGIWPNPFGYRGKFSAEDTGGAIKGKRIDFYDWRGRDKQYAWGRKKVSVGTSTSAKAEAKGDKDSGSTRVVRTPLDERSVTIQERVRLQDSETRARNAMSAGLTAGLDRGANWTRADTRLLGNPYLATLRQELDEARDTFTRERQLTVREGGISRKAAGNGLVYPLARRGKVLGRPGQGTHNGVNGPRNWQSMRAIDLGVPIGTGVRAIASGTITKAAGSWSGGKRQIDGYTATIKTNAPGKQWFYTHLASRSVKAGDRVTAGQTIGRSGAGNGVPHIHLASVSGQTDRLVETALTASQIRRRERTARRATASGSSRAPRRSPGATVMRPVTGPQTSGYGMRGGRMHKGIDYGVPVGTPVRSIHDGMVLAGIPDPGGWGTNTRVSHGGGLSSLYAHLSSVGVRVGQRVGRGQTIARSGNSGRSTGPHLHLETWRNGAAFNPASLIGQRLRGGGVVQRFARGGVVVGKSTVAPPTGRVGSRVDAVLKSTTDRNLSVLDRTLANLAEDRLIGLQRYLATRTNRGGDAQANARIAKALQAVSEQVGFRIARDAARSGQRLAGISTTYANVERDLNRAGTDTDSIAGREARIAGATTASNAALGERYRLEEERRGIVQNTKGLTAEARKAALDVNKEALDAAKEAAKTFGDEATESLIALERDRTRLAAEDRASRLGVRGALAALTGSRDDDRQVAGDQVREAQRVLDEAKAANRSNDNATTRDYLRQAAEAMATAAQGLREFDNQRAAEILDFDAAVADLTETTEDDVAVAKRREADAQRRYDEAMRRGEDGRADATRALGDLKAAREAQKANTTALEELTAQTNALVDLQRQTLEAAQRAEVGQRISQGDIVRALARVMSGSIGSQLFNAGGTPAVAGRNLGGI
ncbi:unannotated protein [freshwater metagenome]|uniref:Unannotated protein n=1 Tax=freshwater metagenome TaxID=449393 RepID=A0A6J7FRP6_9ZZZZ|nr:peptidoglycan DD-metalloendopeptidase family protein [Actinomycetota bacterium]